FRRRRSKTVRRPACFLSMCSRTKSIIAMWCPGLSTACLGQFGASVENVQVAMVCEKAMALFAGGLADHAELDHVLQSLRHSGSREGELFGRRGNRDDGFARKVLVNAQDR